MASCVLLAAPPLLKPAPRLLFNATASAPIGFYLVDERPPKIGDWVVVQPPPALATWMARRGYLPGNVPLLKRLAAGDGQTVCGRGGRITIDGRPAAMARNRDHWGRTLQPLERCQRLGPGEVFLLNADAPRSFDGRYFGPLAGKTVIGRATPLWVGRTGR
ncbi:S26 family signal peptidase [Caulobacter sp. 602-1]|uniref:S26 family signal peptidase n=1 Tax=Caulobacter sp. 602-1 TaxID=2492472 RepID=UPI001F47F0D2|nr:S26 family signal peptidase [Caulobacter sp. 602-1]